MKIYQPSEEVLAKYADVVVKFALGGGKGIKPNDLVLIQAPTSAMPLFVALNKAVILAGGRVLNGLFDDMNGLSRFYFDHANNQQLTAFPAKYLRGLVDEVDHRVFVIGDYDPHELDGVDPAKIMLRSKTFKPYSEWLDAKEHKGKYTWNLVLYGTPAMAKEAKLTLEDYWQQIIKGCYLDKANPVTEWQKISHEVKRVSKKLSALEIDWLDIKGHDVDLRIKVGTNRQWLGGGGRNIPSFEVFTSPDWRGTEGWIAFNQPLYFFGTVIKDIRLEFSAGRVVKATAGKNQKLLREMLATDTGASQVGEFSLTDRRLSRIDKFMADTLFDENIGGKYGNTHIAVGKAYYDTMKNFSDKYTRAQMNAKGFNDSAIHVDMISTSDRAVTATLTGGIKQVIYQKGQFVI